MDNEPCGLDLKSGDVDDRLGFVKKVYAILFVQLALTAGYTAIAITNLSLASWMQENFWLMIICIILILVIEIALICNKKLARTVPINYIALLAFTGLEAYWIAFMC